MLILQVVQDAVRCDTHDDLLEIGCLALLQLCELLVGERLNVVLFEVFFLSNKGLLVRVLKRVIVVRETLYEAIIFFLLVLDATKRLNKTVKHDKTKDPHGARVVSHEGRVQVADGVAEIVTRELDVGFELDLVDDSLKDLPVAQLPEGHRHHHEWHILDDVESQHCHLLVEGRGLTVVVADQASLVDV